MAQDPKASLGDFLRQERERRGVTIEQVVSATKIGVRLLHALEADQYSELPAKPFVRGFVSSYTRFIGLEPSEVLTRFGEFIDRRSVDRPNRDGGHSGYAFEKREGDQSRTFLWVLLASFVALGGGMIVVLKPALKHKSPTAAEKLRSDQPSPRPSLASREPPGSTPPPPTSIRAIPPPLPSPSPAPVPSPSPAPSPSASPPSPPIPSPLPSVAPSLRPDPLNSGLDLKPSEIRYKIIFRALEDVWVRYQVDEKPMTKFILRRDRILVLRAHTAVRFQVSNSKAISLRINGGPTRVASSDPGLVTRQGTPTLFFPAEAAEKIEEPFPNERPLPRTPPPAPRTESPAPTN